MKLRIDGRSWILGKSLAPNIDPVWTLPSVPGDEVRPNDPKRGVMTTDDKGGESDGGAGASRPTATRE